MEESGMTEKELAVFLIDEFANLQRIKQAEDRDREIGYQERVLRARLRVLGIMTENLELK